MNVKKFFVWKEIESVLILQKSFLIKSCYAFIRKKILMRIVQEKRYSENEETERTV